MCVKQGRSDKEERILRRVLLFKITAVRSMDVRYGIDILDGIFLQIHLTTVYIVYILYISTYTSYKKEEVYYGRIAEGRTST